MFGLALFNNEEYTLHLGLAHLTVYFSICSLQREHRSAASFSIGTNGTNRQIVYALPSGVNICSLISTGTIGSVFGLALFKSEVQSNLDYPDLDYPDFSIIRTFFSDPNFVMNIN